MSNLPIRIRAILVMVPAILLPGCFSSHPENIAAFHRPQDVVVTSNEYLMLPPDEVEIHCTQIPEIDGQIQRIRPDGYISFEALGEVYVAGRTPAQVANDLEAKIVGLYKLDGDELIDVRISAFQSKTYYVLGQVMAPGRKLYTGRESVLSALATAVPNPMAWNARIQVIRPSGVAEVPPKVFQVNYNRMRKHGDLTLNVLLQEDDIVYVPPTPFAAVALVIEQVMRPIARAFTGVYILQTGSDLGSGNVGRAGVGGRGGGL
ncbi:MAG: polysaccharide biosynthesis/export family protein [Planctomycetes bacterium]|nr:polysaccharide biosynthesis/export family protein [Planctomycetota bacterium]